MSNLPSLHARREKTAENLRSELRAMLDFWCAYTNLDDRDEHVDKPVFILAGQNYYLVPGYCDFCLLDRDDHGHMVYYYLSNGAWSYEHFSTSSLKKTLEVTRYIS